MTRSSILALVATLALPTALASAGATVDAGRGPVSIDVPASYDPATATPLVLLLHGYSSSGAFAESSFRLAPLVDELGFLYLHPDGLIDAFGNRFWNATDACCDFFASGVDDVQYLDDLIDAVRASYHVDDTRIYVAGHSNGGFMAHRMACERPDRIAAIASVAGAAPLDPADCAAATPVHVLQIHGTGDSVIAYGGGCIPTLGCYPSAMETTTGWADRNACDARVATGPPLDIVATISGAETTVLSFESGCDGGGSSALWTMVGGPHSPVYSSTFGHTLMGYFFDHPKPGSCPTDLDGTGDTGFGDLLAVLSAWGVCTGCVADLDRSGDVGFADLLAVISAWGPC
ncbi:MAG: prolyl oligopeptidase family serine peptidase [Phycisphaerales bacterium]|nr:prolyl oligopeptidase family serine peptidase [Phycisphaerae bacterium]NNF44946.1 prolyl oligopeptidase family serine peptidase [Phycisphaerales bacterium]NNM26242.1 prolyl oligopeptidase family serine peptidase [Phycisphaerales bacterium]